MTEGNWTTLGWTAALALKRAGNSRALLATGLGLPAVIEIEANAPLAALFKNGDDGDGREGFHPRPMLHRILAGASAATAFGDHIEGGV